MLEAHRIAESGAASGSVVWAGHQTAGRGRIAERRWDSRPGDGLLFTVIFTKSDIAERMKGRPFTLLPLLCGLAVSEAAERFLGKGADVRIKWPNDVLSSGRKLSGILCEASGDFVYAGIGINLNQTRFPDDFRRPACSVRQLSGGSLISEGEGRRLLELVIAFLNSALENVFWLRDIEKRLYRIGEIVRMKPGLPEELAVEAEVIEGRLSGLDSTGALLIKTAAGTKSVISGELLL